MKKILLFLFSLGVTLPMSVAQASTFVGNGGNQGDLELQISVKQIKETLSYIQENSGKDLALCTCSKGLEGHGVCETLKSLTAEQVHFCSQFIKSKAAEVLALINSKDGIRFEWTHSDIDVSESTGSRASDAVTNPATSEIILSQSRFLDLQDFERIFLLGHELHHLVKWENKPILDEEQIGPFNDKEGGRKLLNSVGASLAMVAYDSGIMRRYKGALRRSQGHDNRWVYVALQGVNSGYSNADYHVENSTGGKIGLRYDFGNLGIYAEYRATQGDRDYLSTIHGNENQVALGAGLSYKIFFFSNPLSYMGQSFLLVKAGAESLRTSYKISDSFLNDTASASSTGLTAGCSYFTPIVKGFWGFTGISYIGHRYTYNFNSIASLEYNRPQTSIELGASYGF